MPTEKPRVTITISEDQLKQIEEFRFDNKMKNQTQAILSLVKKGLDTIEGNADVLQSKNKKAPEVSPGGKYEDIAELLDKLNAEQVAEIRGYIKRFVEECEAAKAAKQISADPA